MFEIPSPASSISDGEEVLLFEELLEEASLGAHSAANTCSCGEHPVMMAVVGLIASGCVVEAAAAIVAVLGSCKCDESCAFLWDALDVVAQLGRSPDEEKQLVFLWTASVRPAEQEQSTAASIQVVSEASDPADPLEANLATQIDAKVLEAGMGDSSRVEPEHAESVAGVSAGALSVCPELGTFVPKVGSALVSGSQVLVNQIQAYDEEKIKNAVSRR